MVTTQAPARHGATTAHRVSSIRRARDSIHVLQVAVIAVVLGIWSLVGLVGLVSDEVLPTPTEVADALARLLVTPEFWTAVGDTLRGAVTGLVVAAVIGIPAGLITGTYALAERSTRLLFDVLRSFPVIALLPVFLLVLGSTPTTKATVVFIACVFPILLQAQYGARSISPTVDETVRSYRIPRLLRFRKVILPGATPSIMTGLRLAATTSVLVAIGVEILTTIPGIGHMITENQVNGAPGKAFAYILAAGAIGFSINKVSELLEGRLLRWRPPAVAE